MPYYRYEVVYAYVGNKEKAIGSTTPPVGLLEKYQYLTYRYFTKDQPDTFPCRVISAGYERSWPRELEIPVINRFVLRYVTKGAGTYNGKPVRAGQFFFSHPYEKITVATDQADPWELYYIGISGISTDEIMRNAGFFSIPNIQDCPFIDQIPRLFGDLLFTEHPDCSPDLYLMGFFYQLMSMHKKQNLSGATAENNDSFSYYKQALTFIRKYLLEGISPIDVAHYLHISPAHLRVIFRKYCKYSIRELMIRKRLEVAANELIFNQYPVSQVAARIGYEDYTVFSKIFKKYVGVSPLTYKKKHLNISIIEKDVGITLNQEEFSEPIGQ